MKKVQFKAPGGRLVYPLKNQNGKEDIIVLRPGDCVVRNGIEESLSIELINEMYSIIHRTELDDEYYEKEVDIMFEKQKRRKENGKNDHMDYAVDALYDRVRYMTIQSNGRKIVLEKGGLTHNLQPAIDVVVELVKEFSPAELDIFYDIFGAGLTQAEAARQSGLSRTAYNNRYCRLLTKVEKKLKERGIDESIIYGNL